MLPALNRPALQFIYFAKVNSNLQHSSKNSNKRTINQMVLNKFSFLIK